MQAPDGFEHWLLKFDGMGTDHELGASQDYGRIEYAYHLMARVLAQVADAVGQWQKFAEEARISQAQIDAIQLQLLPL